jgi:predicted amidophosphoribosyltransferase
VVTIPPHSGKLDRFPAYRQHACAVLRASDQVDVRIANPVPNGYKYLSRAEKRALRAGRYVCHDDLSGRTVLVMDDVTTTGSTTGAMSDALVEAGAARVIELAWAVTQD